MPPTSGPRHAPWHPSGAYLYAIDELASTVTAFRYDAGRGALESFQTGTTLPAGFSDTNKAAEVAISADGRFLYASNRGDDSLAVFETHAVSGALAPVARVPAGGRSTGSGACGPADRHLEARVRPVGHASENWTTTLAEDHWCRRLGSNQHSLAGRGF